MILLNYSVGECQGPALAESRRSLQMSGVGEESKEGLG